MDPKNMTWEQHEIEMEKYHRIEEAGKVLARLKLELAVRQDNDHVGTGLGGNASELFFLLSHRVKFAPSKNDLVHFSRGENNEIVLEAPNKHKSLQARQALTEFYNSHPDKKELTQQQLSNPSFLRDLNSTSIEVRIMIRALEEAKILQEWLDSKIAFRKEIQTFFSKETAALRVKFLQEMKLPEDYFNTLPKEKDYQEDPIGGMFKKHPVWGAKNDAVNKRLSEIEDKLLSSEDSERLRFIGSCPQPIALFVMRSLISIDRIVTLNLDENENCVWLSEINKNLNEIDEDDDPLDKTLED